MKPVYWFLLMLAAALVTASGVMAADMVFDMHRIDSTGVKEKVGTITVSDSSYGALLTPDLAGLSGAHGLHGTHVHQNPDCGPAQKDGKSVPGLAAGGHYDPAGAGRHEGPYGNGHLGDLPPIYIDEEGKASLPVLAPRLRASDFVGRSLIIHSGGDNYSDHPKPLGGGGSRMVCGVSRN